MSNPAPAVTLDIVAEQIVAALSRGEGLGVAKAMLAQYLESAGVGLRLDLDAVLDQVLYRMLEGESGPPALVDAIEQAKQQALVEGDLPQDMQQALSKVTALDQLLNEGVCRLCAEAEGEPVVGLQPAQQPGSPLPQPGGRLTELCLDGKATPVAKEAYLHSMQSALDSGLSLAEAIKAAEAAILQSAGAIGTAHGELPKYGGLLLAFGSGNNAEAYDPLVGDMSPDELLAFLELILSGRASDLNEAEALLSASKEQAASVVAEDGDPLLLALADGKDVDGAVGAAAGNMPARFVNELALALDSGMSPADAVQQAGLAAAAARNALAAATAGETSGVLDALAAGRADGLPPLPAGQSAEGFQQALVDAISSGASVDQAVVLAQQTLVQQAALAESLSAGGDNPESAMLQQLASDLPSTTPSQSSEAFQQALVAALASGVPVEQSVSQAQESRSQQAVLAAGLGGGHVTGAGGRVVDIAVPHARHAGEAQAVTVGEAQVHMTASFALAFIAEADFRRGREFILGLVLDDVDAADQRAPAEQGRLRPLGHLDALNVEQFDIGAARTGDGDTVLEHGHPGFRGCFATVRGDAADRVAGIVRALLLHDQARREGGEVLEIGDIEIVQQGFIKGRQIDRHISDGLFAELGRDRDHVDAGLLTGLLRICCAANTGKPDQGGGRKKA